jgi:lipopolysaccharide export LptBFGC system permease protein LptF
MMLMALPVSAFAHGEEVIYVMLIPAIGAVLMLIAMFFAKTEATTKGVLLATYIISVIIVLALVNNLPFRRNERLITLLMILVPTGLVIAMYYVIKGLKANSK